MRSYFRGKRILVTGAAGSIGSELVSTLLQFSPLQVRALDCDENGLMMLQRQWGHAKPMRFLLGDVRDKDRLRRAVEDVQIVFHAAALKHVPSCEYNPFEAIKTNVLGTQNLIDAAMEAQVDRFINISTDKVTNTVNVLGSTKLLGERLVVAAQYYVGRKGTRFACVRFGNVIGSRGSVIPLLRDQIQKERRVTLTSLGMTRYVMPVRHAIHLVLESAALMRGGEIFILKMPALKVKDLVDVMVERLGDGKVRIHTIGPRPGERMNEYLITEEEAALALETPDMYVVLSHIDQEGRQNVHRAAYPRLLRKELGVRVDGPTRLLTKSQIGKLLKEERVL